MIWVSCMHNCQLSKENPGVIDKCFGRFGLAEIKQICRPTNHNLHSVELDKVPQQEIHSAKIVKNVKSFPGQLQKSTHNCVEIFYEPRTNAHERLKMCVCVWDFFLKQVKVHCCTLPSKNNVRDTQQIGADIPWCCCLCECCLGWSLLADFRGHNLGCSCYLCCASWWCFGRCYHCCCEHSCCPRHLPQDWRNVERNCGCCGRNCVTKKTMRRCVKVWVQVRSRGRIENNISSPNSWPMKTGTGTCFLFLQTGEETPCPAVWWIPTQWFWAVLGTYFQSN